MTKANCPTVGAVERQRMIKLGNIKPGKSVADIVKEKFTVLIKGGYHYAAKSLMDDADANLRGVSIDWQVYG